MSKNLKIKFNYFYVKFTQQIASDHIKQRSYQTKIIKSLDIFGQSITLNINKRQSLDIEEILYQLQEINKLKALILDRNQIILFNFTQKPNLTLEDEEQLPSRLQIEQYLTEEDKQGINKEIIIKDLYNAWLQIKFDENKKICKQELNQNINQELGNEIQQVFSDSVNSENNQKKQKENSSNNKYEQLLNQFQYQ